MTAADDLAVELRTAATGRPGGTVDDEDVAVYRPAGAPAEVRVRAAVRRDERGRIVFHVALVREGCVTHTVPRWSAAEAVRWAEETQVAR